MHDGACEVAVKNRHDIDLPKMINRWKASSIVDRDLPGGKRDPTEVKASSLSDHLPQGRLFVWVYSVLLKPFHSYAELGV
jgi:hypothetical protein